MRSPFETADGRALWELRDERGLTLEGTAALLAAKLGRPVHITTISKIENDQRQPSDELFDALVEVLDGDRNKLIRLNIPPELAQRIRELDDPTQAAS